MSSKSYSLRRPRATDGYALNQLVKRCPPLDTNSVYCNLLQCSDFSATGIAAEDSQGELVGFISGYRPPSRPDTLFVRSEEHTSELQSRPHLVCRLLLEKKKKKKKKNIRI